MSVDSFIISTGNQANVGAARTTHVDLWNGNSNRPVHLSGIYVIPTLAAVTGVGLTWEAIRTSTIGTGGSALSVNAANPAADMAQISPVSARSKPTGGAAGSTVLLYINTTSEETAPYASEASAINHIPAGTIIEIPAGTGIKIDQTANSDVGSTNIRLVFSGN